MDTHKNTYMYPSFATSILDKIYRSMDGRYEKCQELKFYNNRIVKNTSMYPSFASTILDEICSSMDGENEKQSWDSNVMDEDMESLCRACLLKHEKSRTSCFTAKRPKQVKTTSVSEKMGNLKIKDGLIKSKLRALKIFSNSKKEKQPIWPRAQLVSFVNSLFSNGNSKKIKNNGRFTGKFELDHLAFTGNNNSRFCEELPLYASGLIR